MEQNFIKIDFLKYKKFALIFSLILFIGSVSLYVSPGPKMGVDFAGGTILHVKFNYPVMDQTIRDIFEKDLKIKDVVIQTAEQVEVSNNMTQTAASKGGSTEKLIRTVFLTDKPGKDQLTFQEVKSAIDNGLASRGVKTEAGEAVVIEKTLSEESVGATISHELKYQAMVAILISIILLLGYITVQFEFSFAVPAIIALVHDTMAAIGFLIVTGYEINMIMLAVMLTIVGYSINDTIVISDRIRENMKIMRRTKFHELVNISLNQTFKRTVITTTTTLLPLITMALVGGPVLRQFAVPMIFGALIGTYSSIYVVSSLLVTWKTSKEVVSKSGKVVDA